MKQATPPLLLCIQAQHSTKPMASIYNSFMTAQMAKYKRPRL